MDPEERELLEMAVKLGQENNKILKSMRRSARVAMTLQFFYWVLIIGLSIGAFYFIQPYIDAITETAGNIPSLNGLLEQYNSIKP